MTTAMIADDSIGLFSGLLERTEQKDKLREVRS